jgi:hypothetical protein
VKKVKEYVYTKILKLDQTSTSEQQANAAQSGSNASSSSGGHFQSTTASFNDSNNNNYSNKSNELNNQPGAHQPSGGGGGGMGTNLTETNSGKELLHVINRSIELICSDQVQYTIQRYRKPSFSELWPQQKLWVKNRIFILTQGQKTRVYVYLIFRHRYIWTSP